MARILSGIRATGKLHFGNFLGAVRNFVSYQRSGNECFYFIADLHTLTTPYDPDELRKNIIEIVKDYLAAGLDPEQSVIYGQSSVPEISELSLLLSMLQPLGDLQRTPTFKTKVAQHPDDVTLGLITYPVLMAADILGPQAEIIPVGEDQIPNIELARELARRFNARYGRTFVIPEMMQTMIKVPGLDGAKMGKSDADNAINIGSPMSEIRRRYIKKGATDLQRKHAEDPGDPYHRCQSVYPVHELVTIGETETRDIANACLSAKITCLECKHRLVDGIARILEPFQAARAELTDKDSYVREILHEGGKRARGVIAETVAIVRDKMGIVRY